MVSAVKKKKKMSNKEQTAAARKAWKKKSFIRETVMDDKKIEYVYKFIRLENIATHRQLMERKTLRRLAVTMPGTPTKNPDAIFSGNFLKRLRANLRNEETTIYSRVQNFLAQRRAALMGNGGDTAAVLVEEAEVFDNLGPEAPVLALEHEGARPEHETLPQAEAAGEAAGEEDPRPKDDERDGEEEPDQFQEPPMPMSEDEDDSSQRSKAEAETVDQGVNPRSDVVVQRQDAALPKDGDGAEPADDYDPFMRMPEDEEEAETVHQGLVPRPVVVQRQDQAIQVDFVPARPATTSVAVEARPATVEVGVEAQPITHEVSVEARPATQEVGVEALLLSRQQVEEAVAAAEERHQLELTACELRFKAQLRGMKERFEVSQRLSAHRTPVPADQPPTVGPILASVPPFLLRLVNSPINVCKAPAPDDKSVLMTKGRYPKPAVRFNNSIDCIKLRRLASGLPCRVDYTGLCTLNSFLHLLMDVKAKGHIVFATVVTQKSPFALCSLIHHYKPGETLPAFFEGLVADLVFMNSRDLSSSGRRNGVDCDVTEAGQRYIGGDGAWRYPKEWLPLFRINSCCEALVCTVCGQESFVAKRSVTHAVFTAASKRGHFLVEQTALKCTLTQGCVGLLQKQFQVGPLGFFITVTETDAAEKFDKDPVFISEETLDRALTPKVTLGGRSYTFSSCVLSIWPLENQYQSRFLGHDLVLTRTVKGELQIINDGDGGARYIPPRGYVGKLGIAVYLALPEQAAAAEPRPAASTSATSTSSPKPAGPPAQDNRRRKLAASPALPQPQADQEGRSSRKSLPRAAAKKIKSYYECE